MKYLIITCMRNEAPYILEWLAYHRTIGIDGVLVYSNDCEDGTDVMLDRLQAMGLLTHERNEKISKAGVQWTALKHADQHPLRAEAEWLLVSDVDEFVNIKAGNGHLDDLLAATPEATAFALTWRMFGNNGHIIIQDRLVMEQFTRCARFPCYAPLTSSMFKTLFKNDGSYKKLGVHRPKNRIEQNPDKIHWVNGSGKALGPEFLDDAVFTYGDVGGIDLACINHYSLKSCKAFLTKMKRDLPNRSEKKLDLSYWVDRNFNHVEDKSIQRKCAETKALMADWLSDPELARLHKDGVAWHQNCAESVLVDLEGMRLLTRMASLSRADLPANIAIQLGKLLLKGRYIDKAAREAAKQKNKP